MRPILALLVLSLATGVASQPLSGAEPVPASIAQTIAGELPDAPVAHDLSLGLDPNPTSPPTAQTTPAQSAAKAAAGTPVDKNGNPIPLERRQPDRILGFMPNFRTVSGGAAAHPPGFKYNFAVATHQAFDYSSFIFLGLTSLIAEGTNEHASLGKGVEGFFLYSWRGFADKTDNTYLSAWILPSIFREDTRYYALGAGHRMFVRSLYVVSQQGVARTYSGHLTPNIAGLGGKAATQIISRYYYPPSAGTFGALATKFGYSVMRDVAFSSVREFYPDIAAHYVRKHQEQQARIAAKRFAVPPATLSPIPASPAK